jgi:PAS domain S-box-containing protein
VTAAREAEDTETLSFRKLCEIAGVGLWHIDNAGRTVYMNPAMCELLELDSPAALGSETYHGFFDDQMLERIAAEHRKRREGVASAYEVDLIGRRGTRRTVVISGAPFRDAHGEITGLIGTFTDITGHKRAELRLRASEQRLRSVFETSVDAIGVCSAGLHVMVNPAYARMFGYDSPDDLVGKPIFDLIAPGERPLVAEHVRKRSSGLTSDSNYLTRGVRRNGEEFPMEVHASSYEEDGTFRIVAILRDVSERQALEEQLRQSQKMDALGRLAGGVAHDFNNLLMVMMGSSELILIDAQASEGARSHAKMARAAGERAVGLTRQLLALSRRQVIDRAVVDLHAVVSESSTLLRRLLGPSIELVVEPRASTAHVVADTSQLQQVLMNLCVNARDAMPEGGRIRIHTSDVTLKDAAGRAADDVSNRFVQLSVEDTGHGMTETVQQRVFEPFFTTKPPGEGTGLGLSTVYGIVKQSGGHVRVVSAPGAGSTFSVLLPCAEQPAPRARSDTPAQAREASGRVLLVDDELGVCELLQKFLEGAGYGVRAVQSGAEALRVFREALTSGPFDVVITDVLMPGMSGVSLAHELDRLVPGMPMLFISGYTSDDGDAVISSRPNSAFLAKPFSVPDLLDKLRLLRGGADATPGTLAS